MCKRNSKGSANYENNNYTCKRLTIAKRSNLSAAATPSRLIQPAAVYTMHTRTHTWIYTHAPHRSLARACNLGYTRARSRGFLPIKIAMAAARRQLLSDQTSINIGGVIALIGNARRAATIQCRRRRREKRNASVWNFAARRLYLPSICLPSPSSHSFARALRYERNFVYSRTALFN